MPKTNSLLNLTKSILKNISGRSKDIVEKRFGLFSDKEYTLHAIGTALKVTRERIRQIEKEALKTLRKAKPNKDFTKFISEIKKILKANDGFCEEKHLFSLLSKKYGDKNIDKLTIFLTTLDDSILRIERNNSFKSYWALDKETVAFIETTLKTINGALNKSSVPLTLKQIIDNIQDKKLTTKTIENILSIDNKIMKNPVGEYGLIRWPVIQPYSAKDKAYYLMKFYIKKPIHFEELSNMLKKHTFPKVVQTSYITPKKGSVSLQTIHNELIKDNRFVLIGHGVYALQEWGYQKGVVKDVIINILQASSRSLTEHEITQAVRKQRLVKENTIRLSLRDKSTFKKTPDGKYSVDKTKFIETSQDKENKEEYKILNA